MYTVIQLVIHYNMVYARKLYLITSTNLCPETIIEAKPPNLDSRGVEIKVAQLVKHSYVKRETRDSTPVSVNTFLLQGYDYDFRKMV